MPRTAFAVDVGYGFTKYATLHPETGALKVGSFPSIAPTWKGDGVLAGSSLKEWTVSPQSAVPIEVDGRTYAVGPGASRHEDKNYVRDRSFRYALSDEHLALVRGAMAVARVPDEIRVLAVGLPVEVYLHQDIREDLEKRLLGRHPIPGDKGPRTVVVRRLEIVAQPMGAFVDLIERASPALAEGVTAIIDVGYLTTDWVVTDGAPIPARCGGHAGGVSGVLEYIAGRLKEEHHTEGLSEFTEIDKALQRDDHLFIDGKKSIQLDDYLLDAQGLIKNTVRAIHDSIAGRPRVRRIVLAGGGATLFRAALEEHFPNLEVVMARDSMYANVRGFGRIAWHHAVRLTPALAGATAAADTPAEVDK